VFRALGHFVEIRLDSPNRQCDEQFQTLLRQASDGDRQAQATICDQYQQQVLIVARVLLGPLLRPHLDSVDILQSVHKSLLAGLRGDKFDISSPEKLVSLACSMVRRKVARKWRKHRRQSRFETGTSSQSLQQSLSALVRDEQSTDQKVELADQIAKLHENLTPIERIMLERRLDGFTTGEVAAELQINPVAVRVRWTRLRQRLEAAGIVADWV
jgi:RNA polymerase sigma-70 factor (ECF subfamily)